MRSLMALALFLCACSTPYKKTLLATATGSAIGAIYGATRPEFQSQNAVLYGSIGGLAAGVGALLLDVDQLHFEKTRMENERLKAKLDEFQKKLEPQLVSQGKSLFSSPLPKEVSGLIEPGEWKRYKMDQWVPDPNQANTWYRQVEMFEIIPPTSK